VTQLRDQLARFHAAVTGTAPLESARSLVEDGSVDALTRLHVYAHAYTARIANVLVADYPKLDVVLGSLRGLVADYLRAHPPGHPSLREVGRHVARFLADRDEPAHAVDLARLERARVEVFDGPDATPLGRADLAALDVETFPSLPLRLVPSSRVIELATTADELWDALEAGTSPLPEAVAGPRSVLVWRREITVIHRTLDADEAPLVRGLVAGTTFARACDLLADHPAPAERALELLLRWLDAAILVAG